MPEFLVELYVSRHDEIGTIADRARRAADDLAREGVELRYVRALFVPEDETCFFLYEARAIEDVGAAARRAEIPFDRITEVVVAAAEAQPRQ